MKFTIYDENFRLVCRDVKAKDAVEKLGCSRNSVYMAVNKHSRIKGHYVINRCNPISRGLFLIKVLKKIVENCQNGEDVNDVLQGCVVLARKTSLR